MPFDYQPRFVERHVVPEIPGCNWQRKCAKCPGTNKCIAGDGPTPARVYMWGERPGTEEERYGSRPFSGRTGKELNENYLYLAGLQRNDIYFANTVRCADDVTKTPGNPLIESCSRTFMPYELDAVKPLFLVPLGATACSILPDINLDLHHGMPLKRDLWGKSYFVVPMFHPAFGLHDPRKMTPMLDDWKRLRLILDGRYRIIKDACPTTDYRWATGYDEVASYMRSGLCPWIEFAGLDTETDNGAIWCITISLRPGSGILFRVNDPEALRAFVEFSGRFHWFIHNAVFDLEKLHTIGIVLRHVTCTMQGSYHRGNLPQGLKPLAYRLLGMTMTSYEDTVIPHSRAKLADWLMAAIEFEGENITVKERISEKTGKVLKPKVSQSKLYTRLIAIYRYVTSSPTYDGWKKFDELDKNDKGRLQGALGYIPRRSIVWTPTADALRYAVCDSDAGLRLGLHMRSQERLIRRHRTMSVEKYSALAV